MTKNYKHYSNWPSYDDEDYDEFQSMLRKIVLVAGSAGILFGIIISLTTFYLVGTYM